MKGNDGNVEKWIREYALKPIDSKLESKENS